MSTSKTFREDVLKNKVAFVTGGNLLSHKEFNRFIFIKICFLGGSGICKGMTEAMIRHGAKVVITSRRFCIPMIT